MKSVYYPEIIHYILTVWVETLKKKNENKKMFINTLLTFKLPFAKF